jgi:4-hydroxy-tetrahydrodipicolinate synthase
MMAAGMPGTVTVKALLNSLGLPGGSVRAPLRPAGRETADGLRRRTNVVAASADV